MAIARTTLLLAAAALLLPAPAALAAENVIVKFEPSASAVERSSAVSAAGELVRYLGNGDAALVRPRVSRRSAIGAAASRRGVRYAEPDYRIRIAATPNDPVFGGQWHLENTGQEGGTPGADIRATAAWERFIGGAVTVAVVDTGTDLSHPDLRPALWTNPAETPNGADSDGNGFVDDVYGADFSTSEHAGECDQPLRAKPRSGDPSDRNGHGTHLAGTIGAAGNNSAGVSGISWAGVRIMSLKFLDHCGDGSTSDAIDAISYARTHGARILNASWGGAQRSDALRDEIAKGGFLFVSAAGNGGADGVGDNLDLPGTLVNPDNDEYPAEFRLPNMIVVTASNRRDDRPSYANYGQNVVDVAAPGSAILATALGGGYAAATGTSMAAAVGSGAAALVAAAHPSYGEQQLRQSLIDGADRLDSLSFWVSGGRRLNVDRSLGDPEIPSTAPGAGPAAQQTTTVHPAKMRVRRLQVLRSKRLLDVYAPITSRASGKTRVTFHAAGSKKRFDAEVSSGGGALDRIRFQRRISAKQARLGTGIVTINYPGDPDTRPEEVRLRAASQKAKLKISEISLKGNRLSASGRVTSRARGVIRFRMSYLDSAGTPKTWTARAKIRSSGSWKLHREKTPADVARAGGYLSTLFTGYYKRRIRGEMLAYEINAGQTRRIS